MIRNALRRYLGINDIDERVTKLEPKKRGKKAVVEPAKPKGLIATLVAGWWVISRGYAPDHSGDSTLPKPQRTPAMPAVAQQNNKPSSNQQTTVGPGKPTAVDHGL